MPTNLNSEFHLDEDILFADGDTLHDRVRAIFEAREINLVPGGDRIDTVIALIAAHAAEVEAHGRYRRWVQTVRYLEDCIWLTPEGCPLGLGLQQSRARGRGGQRLVSWVWNGPQGPVLAIHSERIGGRVNRYTWTRVHGLAPVTPEDRVRARREYSGKMTKEAEAVLLKLAKLVC